MSVRVAIALGSNLGDRQRYLHDASNQIATFITHLRLSSFYETAPVGASGDQPMYINAAAVGETAASAPELLEELLRVERRFGRQRPFPGAPRTVDLDLILYDDAVIRLPDLVIPHPRFRERRFVLEPLAEIAPDWRDPVTGKTISELLRVVTA